MTTSTAINDQPIVMYDEPNLVQRETRTITGFFDPTGRHWEDAPSGEHMARYVACTHVRCSECNAATPKAWTMCSRCLEVKAVKEYQQRPRAPWDGHQMLYSEALDRYYSSLDEAEDELEADQALASLRLVLCEGRVGRTLDADDHFCDDLPEDGEVPIELHEAVDALNLAIKAYGVISWEPGKYALDLSTQANADESSPVAA